MGVKSVIIGTAGHIDHGKTTLIQALTGINTDRLEEEKRRGITIDLGFASLDLDDVHIGFVDVPGHERFVKNMLAGAGGIDAFLLVVAADESVMPQTREHVDICNLLGIKNVVATITKSDLVDKETLELATLEVAELLEDRGYEGTAIIPASCITGEGLDELRIGLSTVARHVVVKNENALPRLPIDRIFTMKGFGTVVTGTLIAGKLAVGDSVELLPSGKKSTIKGIQVHGKNEPVCHAGQRIALNLPGLKKHEIFRGEVLTTTGSLRPTQSLDLFCSILATAPGSLEQNQRIRFHLGTAELIGRVAIYDQKEIEPGSDGYARVRLEKPTVALIGDRFVLRRYSPMITIGGGVVLDNLPRVGSHDKKGIVMKLSEYRAADLDQRVNLFIKNSSGIIIPPFLVERFGIQTEAAKSALNESIAKGKTVLLAESPLAVCESENFNSIKTVLIETLRKMHRASPLAEKISLELLKQSLPKGTEDQLFKVAIETLRDEGTVVIEGAYAAATGHVVNMSEEQQKVYESIETTFRRSGTAPPSPAEVIHAQSHPDARALFELMLSRDTLIKIAQDFFCHREVIIEMIKGIKNRSKDDRFSVAQFKEWFGISRKYAIPLLEYLDSAGITYREGDIRKIAKDFN